MMVSFINHRNLNEFVEFDSPFTVDEDGIVEFAAPDIYAPSLYDDELDSEKWEFFSTGYTGQDSYHGPIMHNSEFIGGRLAEDILSTPGTYVALVSYYSPEQWAESLGLTLEQAEDEDRVEGWAIAKLKEDES